MSEPSSLPGLELAAALTDEGRRVLMGHWVAAAVEPLQRGLELLRQPGVREAPEAGGMPHDGEDIRVLVVPWRTAKRQLERGGYGNAATIIALQWLALNRPRVRRAWLGA